MKNLWSLILILIVIVQADKLITTGSNSPIIKNIYGNVNISSYNSDKVQIKIKQGMPYDQARKILLNSGWQTVGMNITPNGSPVCASQWACKYEEIDACSSTGMGFCLMYFYDGSGTYLKIRTIDETPPNAKIDAWSKSTNAPSVTIHEPY